MKERLQKGFFLSALIAVCIANTPAEAGFGSAIGRGLFSSENNGGYNGYSYEEQRQRMEADRKEKEIKAEKETRMQNVFAGMFLIGGGWVYYARSRRRENEAVYNTQTYAAPVVEPKSQILSYDAATQKGKLTTPQGKRYEFKGEDVASGFSGLQFGVKVDFDLSESDTPINIRPADMETNNLASNNAAIAQSQNIASDKPNIVIAPWFMALLYTPFFAFFLMYLLDDTYIFGRYVHYNNPQLWAEALSFVYLFVIMKVTPVTFAYEKIQSLHKADSNAYLVYSRVLHTILFFVPISWVLMLLTNSMTSNELLAFIIVPVIVGVVLFTFKGIAIQVIEKGNSSSNQKQTVLKGWMSGIILLPSMLFLLAIFTDDMFREAGKTGFLLLLAVAITLILKFKPVFLTVTTVNDNASCENA